MLAARPWSGLLRAKSELQTRLLPVPEESAVWGNPSTSSGTGTLCLNASPRPAYAGLNVAVAVTSLKPALELLPPPVAPANLPDVSLWGTTPWHVDRIQQRRVPYKDGIPQMGYPDGHNYTSNNYGTGVNVYLLSSVSPESSRTLRSCAWLQALLLASQSMCCFAEAVQDTSAC